ncbi:MAG TPA: MarR family transcriptional regulator [Micromonosporaceae bacterium]|jgi:DNA-binding MarR family transcriptional regulator
MPVAEKSTVSDPRAAAIEALLVASRAMVAIATRSLTDVDQEITLPQSRALILMATRGPQRIIDIAEDLAVAPSTATRMCDRLVRKGMLRRHRAAADRREVKVTLTPAGRDFVATITARRRRELERVVDAIPVDAYEQVVAALQALNAAAGEPHGHEFWLGPESESES